LFITNTFYTKRGLSSIRFKNTTMNCSRTGWRPKTKQQSVHITNSLTNKRKNLNTDELFNLQHERRNHDNKTYGQSNFVQRYRSTAYSDSFFLPGDAAYESVRQLWNGEDPTSGDRSLFECPRCHPYVAGHVHGVPLGSRSRTRDFRIDHCARMVVIDLDEIWSPSIQLRAQPKFKLERRRWLRQQKIIRAGDHFAGFQRGMTGLTLGRLWLRRSGFMGWPITCYPHRSSPPTGGFVVANTEEQSRPALGTTRRRR